MNLNPNSARNTVNSYCQAQSIENEVRLYPQFFTEIKLDVFRHIHGLTMNFIHPISVISGSNRSGKTSVLMAIACSHYNFDRPSISKASWERATWSNLLRFTNHDSQNEDWEYHITYRLGNQIKNAKGYRKCSTKKWGGAGKKENQIGTPTDAKPDGGRHVCLIDLNRINPGRNFSVTTFNKAKGANFQSMENQALINTYLSYIFETNYDIGKLVESADDKVYQFKMDNALKYSSFNTASGEDVLVNMLSQILHEPDESLILIDEIEIGLHPKIQRRLMDVLFMISKNNKKQFIVTSHSYAVVDSVPKESRLFIENNNGSYLCKSQLSIYETLTRMDSEAFPLVTIYVEDDVSKKITEKAISEINIQNNGFARLVRVVVVGSAGETYNYFKTRKNLQKLENIVTKVACILDGDMKNKQNQKGALSYPIEDNLFFHYSDDAPEKMMVKCYLKSNANSNIQYHVEHSNPHCLFKKMTEVGCVNDNNEAFDVCFNAYKSDVEGGNHFEELKNFVKNLCN